MKFEVLRRRVERAERLAVARLDLVAGQRARLRETWKSAWTPGRIVLLGLAAGFLIARARPWRVLGALGAVSATRWIELATSLSGLFASFKAGQAVGEGDAEDGAGGAAQPAQAPPPAGAAAHKDPGAVPAGEDPEPVPREWRRRPDPAWDSPPPPAEAATELSER